MSLLAPLGAGARSLALIVREAEEEGSAVLVGLKAEGAEEEARAELDLARRAASRARIEEAWVRPGPAIFRDALNAVAKAAGLAGVDGRVKVVLAGGPPSLLLALVVASLASPPPLRRRIVVETLDIHRGGLREALSPAVLAELVKLEEDEMGLAVARGLAALGSASAGRLVEVLGMKRSTVYKKLRELEEKGLVSRESGSWRVHEQVKSLILPYT